jgi:hypothetical protein
MRDSGQLIALEMLAAIGKRAGNQNAALLYIAGI